MSSPQSAPSAHGRRTTCDRPTPRRGIRAEARSPPQIGPAEGPAEMADRRRPPAAGPHASGDRAARPAAAAWGRKRQASLLVSGRPSHPSDPTRPGPRGGPSCRPRPHHSPTHTAGRHGCLTLNSLTSRGCLRIEAEDSGSRASGPRLSRVRAQAFSHCQRQPAGRRALATAPFTCSHSRPQRRESGQQPLAESQ